MSRTFCVFDTEHEAIKSLPLLGHLVANPRRPFDNYRPKIDWSQQSDRTSPMPDKFQYDVVSQKSTTKTIDAAKTAKAKAGLGPLFSLDSGTENKSKYMLSTDELKTYALQQVNDAWEAVEGDFEEEMQNFVKTHKGKAYFMVSLVTATNSYIEREDTRGKSGGGKANLPLGLISSGVIPPSLLDPSVEVEIDRSNSTTNKGKFEGEFALAAEYRVVALVSQYELSLRKLVSRKKLLEDKGTFESKRGGLAFGGDDDDSDIGEEGDEGEMFI
jgi:hypothetical protein